jgi:hypothetical protein
VDYYLIALKYIKDRGEEMDSGKKDNNNLPSNDKENKLIEMEMFLNIDKPHRSDVRMQRIEAKLIKKKKLLYAKLPVYRELGSLIRSNAMQMEGRIMMLDKDELYEKFKKFMIDTYLKETIKSALNTYVDVQCHFSEYLIKDLNFNCEDFK